MIISFDLKLDRFYYIGVMNYLKKIFLFICQSNIQKISYYEFTRQEILHKAKEIHSKEKAAEYYAQNKEAIKEKEQNWYKNLSQRKGQN